MLLVVSCSVILGGDGDDGDGRISSPGPASTPHARDDKQLTLMIIEDFLISKTKSDNLRSRLLRARACDSVSLPFRHPLCAQPSSPAEQRFILLKSSQWVGDKRGPGATCRWSGNHMSKPCLNFYTLETSGTIQIALTDTQTHETYYEN